MAQKLQKTQMPIWFLLFTLPPAAQPTPFHPGPFTPPHDITRHAVLLPGKLPRIQPNMLVPTPQYGGRTRELTAQIVHIKSILRPLLSPIDFSLLPKDKIGILARLSLDHAPSGGKS